MKKEAREKVIELRRTGLSYSDIRKQVKVSKSSLSLWLKSVGLSKPQKQKLTKRRIDALKKGWTAWRNVRIERTNAIKEKAKEETKSKKINPRELFLMGLMLYWAEGSKQKSYNVSEGVIFGNSDGGMVSFFMTWLRTALKISEDRIQVDVYLHENHSHRANEVKSYWKLISGISEAQFGKIYFKRNVLSTRRKNVGEKYYGLARVKVLRSTDLNRQIAGWIEGLN